MDDLISRQQAIEVLRNRWLKTRNYEGIGEDIAEECEVYLKTLPSVQPKPCEDAVSREAVLSMIDTYMNKSVELHYLPTSDGIKKLISILPSAQPNTTTHDSIPAKTGKNDADKTSGDCISRQQAIDALLGITAMRNTIPLDSAIFNIKKLPSAQPETNCSEIPNNSDTINRQAVTKFLNDWLSCLFENCHKQSASDLKMIIKDFKNLPPAQTDIIFCKDCKHYREYSGVVDGCCNMAEWYRRYQYPEDFCSRAERREDG